MSDGADPASVIARLPEAAAMDPDVPIAELSTLASYVSNAMSPTRFMLALIGAFADPDSDVPTAINRIAGP